MNSVALKIEFKKTQKKSLSSMYIPFQDQYLETATIFQHISFQ